MGGLEGGDDPLGFGEQPERVEHLTVVRLHVGGPPDGCEVGVLGPDTRVVEPGRDRVRLQHLPVLVLEQVRLRPVHHTGDTVADGRAARGLDPDEPRVGVDEAREDAGGVRPAAHTGHDDVGVGAVEDRPALLA